MKSSLPLDHQADEPLFAEDDLGNNSKKNGKRWKILVVDDDSDVLAVTRLVFSSLSFEGCGIDMHTAKSAQEAKQKLLENSDFAMAFVDVVMESDQAGLELVRYIRDDLENNDIQIVLRTGQPGYAPEMQVILEYGINDYRTKTELDNVKLVTALVSALRNYKNIVSARQAVREQEISEQVSRSKTLFFAQISHDFRAPLNGILGFCQLLSMSPLKPEQKDQVTLIRQSGRHLLSLVNDILDLSKAEAGKVELEIVPLNVIELVQETCKLLETQVNPGVKLQVCIDSDVPQFVLGDGLRIRQILNNLLSNAIKFTEQGEVLLSLKAEQSSPPNWRFEFAVTDTGMGIPAARLPTLFSAYEQADASISRSFGGTGLGLAICKQLANLMCGDIEVHSEEGNGSTFSLILELPITHAVLKSSSVAEEIDSEEEGPLGACEFARILVVDDDVISRMLMFKMLIRRGFQVVCVEDGIKAVELIQREVFDLVFVDCMMPNMDGFELTERLRQEDSYNKVPVVALTGADASDEMQRCFSVGMNDYLQKPIDLENLNAMVTKWLGFRTMMP